MHFSIQRDKLIEAVQDVLKAVSPRTTIPVLTGIKITATSEGVTFTGSDSDVTIEATVPLEEEDETLVELVEAGSIVLQARYFGEIVKKLPASTVTIEVMTHLNTQISSGNAKFNLNGMDADEYPLLPAIEEDQVHRMPIDLLKTMIKQTAFSISTSESRPILTGVNWAIDGNDLVCTATDSHRLALRQAKIDDGDGERHNVVIPGKSLTELSKILGDTDRNIDIVMTERQILFRTPKLLFFSRLLEGNYPDTSKLIPESNKTSIEVNTKEFLQAIDRASLIAKEDRNNVVKLTISEGEHEVKISSNSPEIGKVIETVSAQVCEGDTLTISFSAKFMMDALRVINSADIRIDFTGAMRPFVIRGIDDVRNLYMIVPVRTH
ncbi:DNA polymerase III subunit beta [Bacillaceae bacterium SIJ1]|uniref:DNA polymerase III subunit beta n=1 Tax=Litoribacterium kuwaitense TaxID=1398745 RepID=UPI0013EA01B2|nr:DNA polymerase III subunit beta [Litoribacterium kuwaitense]NGP45195.1 DNA polymerase III subunit beta [Litoribacterium kuwaitense]